MVYNHPGGSNSPRDLHHYDHHIHFTPQGIPGDGIERNCVVTWVDLSQSHYSRPEMNTFYDIKFFICKYRSLISLQRDDDMAGNYFHLNHKGQSKTFVAQRAHLNS